MTLHDAYIKRINELCIENGINYYNISYRAAIPKSTIYNIVNGTNPTINTTFKICESFHLSLKDFFDSEHFECCDEFEG